MKVGLANGCFDCLHAGHVHFLEEAARHCDYLIVAVNSDRSVRQLKGEGRPVEPLEVRIGNLVLAELADAVIKFEGRTDQLIMEIRPDVVIRGYDQGDVALLQKIAMRIPGWRDRGRNAWDVIPIVRIEHLPGHSTSLHLSRAQAKTGAP